jgi:hypothetical protein
MSKVDRWSRLLTAILGAIGILLAGLGLLRAEVIKDRSTALWPTYDLLNLEILHDRMPASTMAFSVGIHVLIWTAILYALLSLGRRLRSR